MPAMTRAYQALISAFIAIILLLQAATSGGFRLGIDLGSRSRWPIIAYLMYDEPHYEGETIQAHYQLEGVLRDGTVIQIAREDLGLNFWNYLHLGNGLAKDSAASLALLLKLYPKASQLVEVRVKTLPFMITRTGQAFKEPVVVRAIPVNVPQ